MAPADFLVDSDVQADPMRPGRFTLDLSPAWNIFYAFGGMTMACALRAATRAADRPDLDLLSAHALFLQPVTAGSLEVETRVLRSGSSAAQVVAELRGPDHDGAALHLTALLGRRDEAPFAYLDTPFPDVPMPEGCELVAIPEDDEVFGDLAFTHQVAWRIPPGGLGGPPQLAGGRALGRAESWCWTRLRNDARLPDGTIDPVSLTLPADWLGPAISERIGQVAFMVLSLSIDLQVYRSTTSSWLLQHVRVPVLEGGYASGTVELWDEDRQLVASATQRARIRPLSAGERPGPA